MNILFINSKNHWENGWLNTPTSLRFAMDTLNNLGISVSCSEIQDANELEKTLGRLPKRTLLWPNAYYTQGASGEVVWLQEFIENRELPYVGSPVHGLKNMLNKPNTHQLLSRAGVAIPDYLSILRSHFHEFDKLIANSELTWPVVVKPSCESCSMGVIRADTPSQAKQHIEQLFDEFPFSEALLETFLPSEDITCGFLALGNDILLLPTYYKSLELSGKKHVVERDLGKGPWGGSSIVMPPIKGATILNQLQDQMLKLTHALQIAGITRVDARLDEGGILRFFDVNGMPALSYPKSVLVRQVRQCFPHLPDVKAYEYLLKTVVLIAAERFNLKVPGKLCDEHLFSMDSKHGIRLSALRNTQYEAM